MAMMSTAETRKTPVIICLFLSLNILVYGGDSLVYFSDLEFNSEYEKHILTKYFSEEGVDYLALFMALDKDQNQASYQKAKDQYMTALIELNDRRFKRSSEKKKIKLIYKYIHDHFFRKYELITLFHEIFEKGYFNCLTGSALYALILHDLQIPFVIKETPYHVFLLTYPESYSIQVESTDAVSGYYSYDFRTKSNFVEHLRKNKIISQSEYAAQSVDHLFDKYYFAQNDISIDELVGMHYMNHAAYLLDERDMKKAYRQLEKAYLFHSSEKIKFMMFTALTGIIARLDYEDKDDLKYLVKITRFRDYDLSDDQIIGEFSRLTQKQLIEKSTLGFYQESYHFLNSRIQDSTLLAEMSFIYHYETGRYLHSKGKMKEGFDYFEKAYELKPNNSQVQSLFIYSLYHDLTNRNTEDIILLLEKYGHKYPKLAENSLYKGILLEAYLIQIKNSFQQKDPRKGEELRAEFESSFQKELDIPVNNELIVSAYAEASVYYFRKGRYVKAREILLKGLEYVPESYELKYRLSSF